MLIVCNLSIGNRVNNLGDPTSKMPIAVSFCLKIVMDFLRNNLAKV